MPDPEADVRDAASNQLRASLKIMLGELGMSASAWSLRAGIPESTLRNFLTGRSHDLQFTTLAALADAARVDVSYLISRCGRERNEAAHGR